MLLNVSLLFQTGIDTLIYYSQRKTRMLRSCFLSIVPYPHFAFHICLRPFEGLFVFHLVIYSIYSEQNMFRRSHQPRRTASENI